MDIEVLMGVLGVLGFLLSVFVFILTRWERRTKILVELFTCYDDRFYQDIVSDRESNSMIGIRVINIGVKPIAVDKKSFKILGNGMRIRTYDTDWEGLDKIPYPTVSGTSFEVAVYTESFEVLLGREGFEGFMYKGDFENTLISVTASFKDQSGRNYSTSKKYKYSFEVSEFLDH